MNIEVRACSQKTKLDIVDCDFHPKLTLEQLQPLVTLEQARRPFVDAQVEVAVEFP